MSGNQSKVGVVVLTWNDFKNTQEILNNLDSLDTSSLRVTVYLVDNGSTNKVSKTLQKLTLKNLKLVFIRNSKNLGFAGGNNQGIKKALSDKAEYILLINNDILLSKNILTSLVEVAEKDEKIGLISPKIYFAKGFEFHKKRYKVNELGRVIWYAGGVIDWNNVYAAHRGVDSVDKKLYQRQEETDFATGACMLVRGELLKEIGLFDEDYFLYWEDSDFSVRAKKRGWKVIYAPSSGAWHKVAGSSAIGSELNDYFLTRNRMVFGLRYASFKTKQALIRESVRLLMKGRRWQKIAIKDFYTGRLGKGSWVNK